MLRNALVVWVIGAMCAPLVMGAAAKATSRPVDRADFANRVWIADFSSQSDWPGKIVSMPLKYPDARDLNDLIKQCDDVRTCRRHILVAGTAYLKGYGGTKETVEVTGTASLPLHMALLHSYENHESLTDGLLAIFPPNDVVPLCYSKVLVPGKKEDFYYGRWRIERVYTLRSGNYMAWIVAGGGDGGYVWSLQRFVEVEPACKVVQQKDYLVSSSPPERYCDRQLETPTSYFSILETGQVKVRRPKKDCNSVTLSPIPSRGRVQ